MWRRLRTMIVVTFAVVVFGAGLVGWMICHQLADPENVRSLVLRALEDAMPDAVVELESAEARWLGGLRLHHLRIKRRVDDLTTPDEQPNDAISEPPELVEIAHIAEIVLVPDHDALLTGSLELRHLAVSGAEIKVRQSADGRWDVAALLPRQRRPIKGPLKIEIRNSTIQLGSEKWPDVAMLVSDVTALGTIAATGVASAEIKFTHNWLGRLTASATALLPTGDLEGHLETAEPLELSALRAALPPSLGLYFTDCTTLDGRLAAAVRFRRQAGEPPIGDMLVSLDRGAVDHPFLPYPVRDLTMRAKLDLSGMEIDTFEGNVGPARVAGNLMLSDWSGDNFVAHARANDVPFAEPIYRLLPLKEQQTWDKFLPEGAFDGAVAVQRDAGRFIWTAAVEVHDNACTFYKFPYRVTHVAGRLDVHADQRVVWSGTGHAGGQVIELSGRMSGISPTSHLVVDGKGVGVTIDQQLIDAVPSEAAAVIRKFDGTVTGDFTAHIERAEGNTEAETRLEIDVHAPRLRNQFFNYPLEDVSGHLTIQPFKTIYRGFTGRWGEAVVELEGQAIATTDGPHVETFVRAKRVALDQTLRAALDPAWRGTIDALKPEGYVDVTADVVDPANAPIDVRLKIDPSRATIAADAFPYRLETTRGIVEVANGRVFWNRLQARHGNNLFECDGEVVPTPAGGSLRLARFRCDQLAFDNELRSAIPGPLRQVVDFIQPGRPLSLHMKHLIVDWSADQSVAPAFAFDAHIGFQDTSLLPSIGINRATGTSTLLGQWNEQTQQITGNLNFHTLNLSGFTATDVSSRLLVDGSTVRLPNLKANFYRGQLHAEIIGDAATPQYECRVTTFGSQLGDYVSEQNPASPPIQGTVDAYVYLNGKGQDIERLKGRGSLTLRDADLYRLPFFLSLFDVLNAEGANRPSLDQVETDFRFEGMLMLLDRIECVGPSMSLTNAGEGRVNLQSREVDVRLNPRIRPRWVGGTFRIPLLTDTFNTASDQLITLHVNGPLNDPVVMPEAVPGLRRLFQGPARPADARPPENRSR